MNELVRLGIILLLFCNGTLSAQTIIGLSNDHYSGTNSLRLNPALIAQQPLQWDFRLIGGHGYASTNSILLENQSVPKLLKGANEELIYDEKERSKFASLMFDVLGPAASFRVGQTVFHIETNVRAAAFTGFLPRQINASYWPLDSLQGVSVDPFEINAAMYNEFSIGMSKQWHSTVLHSVGFQLKWLQALGGATLDMQGISTYVGGATDETIVTEGSAVLGYTEMPKQPFTEHGNGIAMNIGWAIQTNNWNLGISLHDFGRIWYNSVQEHSRHTVDARVSVSNEAYADITDLTDLSELMSENFVTNELAADFSIGTPASMHLHIDYEFKPFWYISGIAFMPVKLSSNQLTPDFFQVLSIRRENRLWGWQVPVSLLNGQQFRIGSSIRFGPLSFGTENIASWLIEHKLRNADFHFSLRITDIFFSQKAKINRQGLKSTSMPCYSF